MAQIDTGIRSVLARPAIYGLFQRAIGSKEAQRDFVSRYVQPRAGERLLDIGCGPGTLLEDLSDIGYVGFDPSPSYIKTASQKFGARGRFIVGGIDDVDGQEFGRFDIVLAKGVLHHLDDTQVDKAFATATAVLNEGARVVTVDPCFLPDQPWLARFLISRDRGQNVRDLDHYRTLAERWFPKVETHVRTDRLRVPYSHLIMVCRKA